MRLARGANEELRVELRIFRLFDRFSSRGLVTETKEVYTEDVRVISLKKDCLGEER